MRFTRPTISCLGVFRMTSRWSRSSGRSWRSSISSLRGREAVKSSISKRSIVITGHKTSVSLEDELWKSLKDIAGRRGMTVPELVWANARHGHEALTRQRTAPASETRFTCPISCARIAMRWRICAAVASPPRSIAVTAAVSPCSR